MKETATMKAAPSDAAKEFANTTTVPPERLLKLIRLWRHLQAGSSHRKCKGHSTID